MIDPLEVYTRDDIVAKKLIHTCHNRRIRPEGEVISVKSHAYLKNGKVVPHLDFIKNPKRDFYITRPGLRERFPDKKEWEKVENLDKYTVYNYQLPHEIYKALHGYYPNKKYLSLRDVLGHPHVYGAGVSIESLINRKYSINFQKSGLLPCNATVGMFDTETDAANLEDKDLIMATISHEKMIFTAVLKKSFFRLDKHGNHLPGDLEEFKKFERETFSSIKMDSGKIIDLYAEGYTFETVIVDSKIDILRYIFGKIHQYKTDFIGVWNMEFDYSVILKTCEDAGVNIIDIVCPPEVPEEFRYSYYKKDNTNSKQVSHYTRRWDWWHCTSYSQFYDACQLYSRLRIVDGFKSSYKLNDILKEEIGMGKLKFKEVIDSSNMSEADWHRYMQIKYPYEYILYNKIDVVGPMMMESSVKDTSSLLILSDFSYTPVSSFNKQTVRCSDSYYPKALELQNKIISSAGLSTCKEEEEEIDDDEIIEKKGGAVLDAEKTCQMGRCVIEEYPDFETYVYRVVNDVDLSGIYPNLNAGCNISSETRLSTLINIKGRNNEESQQFSSLFVNLEANAVNIGTEFFNLPNFTEMEALFKESMLL